MNVTFAICLIIFFSFIGEFLTWIARKDKSFTFVYATIIRIFVVWLSICTIWCATDKYSNYEFLNKDNSFKYELIQHQDSLINHQRRMIDALADDLWYNHDCDIPQFDGELKDNIDYEEQYLDSLYNVQF